MTDVLATLIVAHLIGDFLFQNDWMQNKSEDSLVCSVHVMLYAQPFILILFMGGIPLWVFLAIIIQHWLQDRFSLHMKWMQWYGQTPPTRWPVGPLCVDQAFHIAFIGVFYALSKGF